MGNSLRIDDILRSLYNPTKDFLLDTSQATVKATPESSRISFETKPQGIFGIFVLLEGITILKSKAFLKSPTAPTWQGLTLQPSDY